MLEVSRANNLRIPKTIKNVGVEINSVEDKVAVKQAIATANDEKYNKAKITEEVEREEYQKEAIIKLKMLGYISMIAENANCILSRQYKQISLQIGEAINLIAAWKKSDDDRWRNRK